MELKHFISPEFKKQIYKIKAKNKNYLELFKSKSEKN